MSGNTNPGNFANRPKEEVKEIASKGGHASHSGGFASMDPEKQVSSVLHKDFWWDAKSQRLLCIQHEIASMGRHASSG
jgi:hypothetical protein